MTLPVFFALSSVCWQFPLNLVYEVAFLSTLDVNQTHLKPLEVRHLAFISFIRLFNTRVEPVNIHVATQPTPLTLDGMADTFQRLFTPHTVAEQTERRAGTPDE